MTEAAVWGAVGALGLAAGSLADLLAWRLVRHQSLRGRSRCPGCATPLAVWQVIPLLGWAIQRGRCHRCGHALGWRAPAVELTTALLVLLAFARFGPTPAGALAMVLAVGLVVQGVMDLEAQILSDGVSLTLAAAGAAFQVLADTPPWLVSLGGALALLGAWGLRAGAAWRWRREALGLGDVKFLGMAGLWLPLMHWPLFLITAGTLGTLMGLGWRLAGARAFPFAPALALALYGGVLITA